MVQTFFGGAGPGVHVTGRCMPRLSAVKERRIEGGEHSGVYVR